MIIVIEIRIEFPKPSWDNKKFRDIVIPPLSVPNRSPLLKDLYLFLLFPKGAVSPVQHACRRRQRRASSDRAASDGATTCFPDDEGPGTFERRLLLPLLLPPMHLPPTTSSFVDDDDFFCMAKKKQESLVNLHSPVPRADCRSESTQLEARHKRPIHDNFFAVFVLTFFSYNRLLFSISEVFRVRRRFVLF